MKIEFVDIVVVIAQFLMSEALKQPGGVLWLKNLKTEETREKNRR
jgi:hypothetical protein